MPTLAIEIVSAPDPAQLQIITQGLIDHAAGCGIEPRNHAPLTLLLRDPGGIVQGGLVGTTVWGWLQIAQLWVADVLRGRGHGAALMRAAEDEGLRRGCHHAMLDTFDFQARGFYEHLGYRVFGELREFPRGHTRFFLAKAL